MSRNLGHRALCALSTFPFLAGCGDDRGGVAGGTATSADITSTTIATSAEPAVRHGRMLVDVETGEIRAPGFNDLIDETRPTWAATPRGAAEMLLGERSDDTELTEEDGGTVVATIAGLQDDSVDAIRYELRFTQERDGLYRFLDGTWSQRCRPGRGHDDEFLADECL